MDLRGFSKISLNALFYLAALRVGAAVDIDNEDFIKECVDTHNLYRSQVDPPASDMLYMSWDRTLAEVALAWSKKCIFDHNTELKVKWKLHPIFKTIGENIYVQTGSSLSVPAAIKSWHDEIRYYDYNTNRCRKICGHYTQLVWASSYKVGCAVHFCPGGITDFSPTPSTIFVCDYGPPGNYPRRPYLTGTACTQCPDSWCENRLCRNATREMTNNPGSACGNYCIAVLVMRPLTLLIIVGGVYLIQQKHDNLKINALNAISRRIYRRLIHSVQIKVVVTDNEFFNASRTSKWFIKGSLTPRITMLIWGNTYKIGCSAHHCPNHIGGSKIKKGIIFVCNYVCSGNRKGEKPCIKGASCTYCGADFCRYKLCSDPDREEISQYPNWKPDLGSASILLSKCLLLMSITIIYIL